MKIKYYSRYFTSFLLLLLICFTTYGQVGINTNDPNAILDIRSSNQANPSNKDGVLMPKIDNFPFISPTVDQNGMLVFVTGSGTPNKGFYYWDNALTNWMLLTGSSGGGSGNTLDQAYDQGGVGLGRTIDASNGAVRINGEDGFLVTGDVYFGNPISAEITGAGTRMFFNPRMSAFRAGTIWDFAPLVGDEWDDANIGVYSTAFGVNTKASNSASTAFGSFTRASGNSATALGSGTIASGYISTAFGTGSIASGSHSMAFGYQVTSSSNGSIAFGNFTTASGIYSTAFGHQSSATALHSTSFGSSTTASGNTSTAFGTSSTASGNVSTAFGASSTASGNVSTAFGLNTTASGFASTAFGVGTTAPSSYETTLGMYNTTYTPVVSGNGYSLQDRIFVVGNGTSDLTRSNALTIYKSGLLNINDEYDMPLTDGTVNQVMTTNGTGAVSFQDINVSNTVYSLNQSYSLGGTGAGRIINAIYGPVEIQNNGGLIVSSFNQPNMLFVDGNNDAVGINTAVPTADLSVNGTVNKPGGGTWAVFSDARLKKNISDYKEGLELIKKIRPVNFSYNTKMKEILGENKSIDDRVYQGVIAQELQIIAPDMVREIIINKLNKIHNSDSSLLPLDSEIFLEVDPNKFTYALINAVQEQQEMIIRQQDEINEQDQIIETQNTKIVHIEKQLKKLHIEMKNIKELLKKFEVF